MKEVITLSVDTSESFHLGKYGKPEDCFKKYVEEENERTNEYKDKIDLLLTGKCNNDAETKHINEKWDILTNSFINIKGNVLDIGSFGYSDMFILERLSGINKIVCVDGNENAIKQLKPYLDPRITQFNCDFLKLEVPNLNEEFDVVLQIDFAEHVPDHIYNYVTMWSISKLKSGGCLLIYTPMYPNCVDQVEHISVKSTGYFVQFLLSLNMQVSFYENNGRLFISAVKLP